MIPKWVLKKLSETELCSIFQAIYQKLPQGNEERTKCHGGRWTFMCKTSFWTLRGHWDKANYFRYCLFWYWEKGWQQCYLCHSAHQFIKPTKTLQKSQVMLDHIPYTKLAFTDSWKRSIAWRVTEQKEQTGNGWCSGFSAPETSYE